jgi:hypothetical protein
VCGAVVEHGVDEDLGSQRPDRSLVARERGRRREATAGGVAHDRDAGTGNALPSMFDRPLNRRDAVFDGRWKG